MSRLYDRREERKCHEDEYDSDEERMERLYRKFKKMMICDPELMVQGSEYYADIYNTAPQTVAIDGSVTFEFNDMLSHVEHAPLTSAITIKKSGIYFIFTILNVNDPSQWTLFINGVPATASTAGTNAGATQFQLEHIRALNCGDVLTINNYSSVKEVGLTSNAGGDGTIESTNAEIILFRIAPYLKRIPK
jgi:hypothetical protein